MEIDYVNILIALEEAAIRKQRPWMPIDLITTKNPMEIKNSQKGQCLHQNFSFNKNTNLLEMDEKVSRKLDGQEIPPDMSAVELANIQRIDQFKRIRILKSPFAPPPLPSQLFQPEVWINGFTESRIYLLGTKHFSKASKLEVKYLIQETLPDVLFIELDKYRVECVSLKKCEFKTAFKMATKTEGNAGLVLGDNTEGIVFRNLSDENYVVLTTLPATDEKLLGNEIKSLWGNRKESAQKKDNAFSWLKLMASMNLKSILSYRTILVR